MGKTCVICGKPSGMYPLCRDCFKLKDDEKIVKCENCGTWHYTDQKCKCELSEVCATVTEKQNDSEIIFGTKELTERSCIICGEQTDGFLFCKRCYHKYKSRDLLLRITECKNIEILDDSYEGRYTCNDGHVVKSKSEMLIDNELFERHIYHSYEAAFPIDGDESHDLHPDFYLTDLDIYIEHWGFDSTNKKYTETKDYKIPFYIKSGKTFIFTDEKDMNNVKATLKRKLDYIKPGTINEYK